MEKHTFDVNVRRKKRMKSRKNEFKHQIHQSKNIDQNIYLEHLRIKDQEKNNIVQEQNVVYKSRRKEAKYIEQKTLEPKLQLIPNNEKKKIIINIRRTCKISITTWESKFGKMITSKKFRY